MESPEERRKRWKREHYQRHREVILTQRSAYAKANRAKINERIRRYYKEDPEFRERKRQRAMLKSNALKAEMLEHYGETCICCGEIEPVFLTLDHIAGDGADHRRSLSKWKTTGARFYAKLRSLGWPVGYQTLCWNCNSAKHIFGSCPHTW